MPTTTRRTREILQHYWAFAKTYKRVVRPILGFEQRVLSRTCALCHIQDPEPARHIVAKIRVRTIRGVETRHNPICNRCEDMLRSFHAEPPPRDVALVARELHIGLRWPQIMRLTLYTPHLTDALDCVVYSSDVYNALRTWEELSYFYVVPNSLGLCPWCGMETDICDCGERVICDQAGSAGHRTCGYCDECNFPLFMHHDRGNVCPNNPMESINTAAQSSRGSETT